MKELAYIRSPSQGNIYSVSRLENISIIGSGNYGKILAHLNSRELEEIPLSNIPYGADIISLAVITDPYLMLGVTYVMKVQSGAEEIHNSYLNFYTTWKKPLISSQTQDSASLPPSVEEMSRKEFEILGSKCIQFRLNYIPYHLVHTKALKSNGSYDNVFLLSGSDCRIHTYEPNDELKSFSQIQTSSYFPELDGTFQSVVTRIHVEINEKEQKRITICGCEDGKLKIFTIEDPNIVKVSTNPKENTKEEESSVDLYGDSPLVTSMNEDIDFGTTVSKITHFYDGLITGIKFYSDDLGLNAVISSANSPVYLYRNVLQEKFNEGTSLKFSTKWDCIECICVADMDFDGKNEIAVGTFGCTLLIYKQIDDKGLQWVIVSHRKFSNVIFSIEFFDYHLYVVTGAGLHIIEYSPHAYFRKRGIEPSEELIKQYLADSTNKLTLLDEE